MGPVFHLSLPLLSLFALNAHFEVALSKGHAIAARKKVVFVRLVAELALLPKFLRPFSEHLVSNLRLGPTRLVVGGYTQRPIGQDLGSHFVGPDIEMATVSALLRPLAPKPVSAKIVHRSVWTQTLEQKAVRALVLL